MGHWFKLSEVRISLLLLPNSSENLESGKSERNRHIQTVIVAASELRNPTEPFRDQEETLIVYFMAKEQHLRPWFLDLVPALVVLLAAAHVIALGYWIYRLATDRRPQRGKFH